MATHCKIFPLTRVLITIFSLAISLSEAQVFSPKVFNNVPATMDGAITVGDYDQDGDLDFAVIGQQAYIYESINSIIGGVGFTGIYKNTGGEFTQVPGLNLIEARYGDIAWGDFDNDGDLDLIVSGHPTGPNATNTKVLALYKNNGNDSFESMPTNIIPFSSGKFALIDFDKDGLLDIGITGWIQGQFSSIGFADVYKNNGNFDFQRMHLNIAQVASGTMSFIDIENDGDWDIILNGFTNTGTYKTYFFLNNNNTLTQTTTQLEDVGGSVLGVHDLNNDGFTDVVLSGYSLQSPNTMLFRIYMNDNGTLQPIQTNINGLKEGSIDFADFDGDNDIDLLITGATDATSQILSTKIIRNDAGVFTVLPNAFEGSFRGGAKWGDFDLDGDIDFIKFPNNTILYSQFNTTVTSIQATICQGTTYYFNEQELAQSGTYSQTFHVTASYDSIVNLTLTVTPAPRSFISSTICSGSTYLFDGDELSIAGVYTKIYKTSSGCDSVAEVTLNVTELNTKIEQEGSHLRAVENDVEYQWYNCDLQMPIEGETKKILKVMKDGNYAVFIKKGECTSKSECVFAKSIFENYPNPAKNIVNFKLADLAQYVEVRMINKSGAITATWKFSNVQEFDILIDSFPDGQCFFQIFADGKMTTSKILKKGN
jgi:hypothetical protein